MYDLTNMISFGIAGIVCAHIASERGWTDEWKTVKRTEKRTPSIRKVVVVSTEPTDSLSDNCDSAIVMSDSSSDCSDSSSDSTEDFELPWHKKCTTPNNPFACLDYFLDWDEAPDDFLIHLAGVDFIDKQDPWINDTSDVYLDLDSPATHHYELWEDIDRPFQQAEFRIMKEEEALEAAARSTACTTQAPLDLDASDWTFPEAWNEVDPYDSISVCGFKWRHDASFGSVQEDIDPDYRDTAGAGLMSPLERKTRLRDWLMASEHCGTWDFSSIEEDTATLFQLHAIKLEIHWGTRSDLHWGDEEDVGFETLYSEEGSDDESRRGPFRWMTVACAKALMARGAVVDGNWGDAVCVGLVDKVMAVRALYSDASCQEQDVVRKRW